MRNQRRNEQEIHYALYEGWHYGVNASGKMNGDKVQEYTDPTSARMSVSAAKGAAEAELFGITEDYSKTLITHDMTCPIDETSVLWIDADPLTDPYDYIVVRVARSLNFIAYAVREVKVTCDGV